MRIGEATYEMRNFDGRPGAAGSCGLPVYIDLEVEPPGPRDVRCAAADAASHAARIRDRLRRAGVLAVRLVGPPGAGKTTLVDATLARLRGRARVGVIVCNPAASRDAARLARRGDPVVAVDAAVPDAAAVDAALDQLDLDALDLVLIEACGGIAAFPDVGQDETVAVLSVCGGDDKAAEYALLVASASALLLTKTDLRARTAFDAGAFLADVRRVNPDVRLIELAAASDGDDAGMGEWLGWLGRRADAVRVARDRDAAIVYEVASDLFFG